MPEKTAIGFYIENYSPGGLERMLFDLLAGVPQDRFSPILFYAGDKTFPERLKQEKGLSPKLVWVPVFTTKHVEEWVWSKRPPRFLWLAFLGIIDLVRWLFAGLNIQPCRKILSQHPVTHLQVINGGYPAARSCLSAVIAARELSIGKVTMTVTATPQLRRWPLLERYFDRRVNQSCDFVISNCDYLTGIMKDARGFSKSKALTIYGGIPMGPFPSESEIQSLLNRLSITGRPLIGSVAVLLHHKGQRYLLQAVAELKRDFPDLCCLLVGDGAERGKLQEMAERLGISKNVCFAGHLRDFRTAMAAMDVFVHPSLEEGFPYVILEAMSLGRPIVATRVAGVPEQIIDGQSGLLVDPGQSATLSAALHDLLTDLKRAQALGDNAKSRAQLFSEDQMIAKFSQLYGA